MLCNSFCCKCASLLGWQRAMIIEAALGVRGLHCNSKIWEITRYQCGLDWIAASEHCKRDLRYYTSASDPGRISDFPFPSRAFLLAVGAFLLTVELLCSQSVKALARRSCHCKQNSSNCNSKSPNCKRKAPNTTASKKAPL